jgi:3-dehydroquinate synthase
LALSTSIPDDRRLPRNSCHIQRFSVPFEYPVFFTEGVLEPANLTLVEAVSRLEPARRHRLLATLDGGLADAWPGLAQDLADYAGHHPAQLELIGDPLRVPGGEAGKNDPAEVTRILQAIRERGVDRHAFVVAFGGGASLDLVGFAAGIAHRGIRVIRVPTTVLSQADSGVGVKNGVNAFAAKNFLGTFAAPFAVINDTCFLATLEPRDRRAGLAEAVKVALIRDPACFESLVRDREALAGFEPVATARAIRRSAELHLEHIATSGDPFELGSARPLDYGHWAAHRLESLSDHGLRHGEAVAIGLALDARYARLVGLLPEATLERICGLLEGLGLRLWDSALEAVDPDGELRVLAGLREFREHLGGELTVPMLRGVGDPVDLHEIDPRVVSSAIAWLKARDATRCG